jgi:hypothetical protein
MPCGPQGRFDISRLSQGFIVIQKQVSIFAPVKIAGLDNRPFKPGLRDPPHRRGPDAGKRYHPTAAGHQKSCAEEGGTKEGVCSTAQLPIQDIECFVRALSERPTQTPGPQDPVWGWLRYSKITRGSRRSPGGRRIS